MHEPAGADTGPPDPAAQLEAAREICLRLLTVRARSRAELATALARRGVQPEAAGTVLDRLQDVGLIDDAGYAVALAQSQHRHRGLARRAVAAKLRQRGLPDDVVGPALATIDAGSERDAAQAFVARKLRTVAGLAPEVAARRLMAALARRGFSADLARQVVRAAVTPGDHSGDPLDSGQD